MFIIGNLLKVVAVIIDYALSIFMLIIIARAVLSWINPNPYNPIVRFIYNITEPVLYRVRKLIPANLGGIDPSPIIVILGIILLQRFVVSGLFELSATFLQNM